MLPVSTAAQSTRFVNDAPAANPEEIELDDEIVEVVEDDGDVVEREMPTTLLGDGHKRKHAE